jgi:vesicle-fusing ATPase
MAAKQLKAVKCPSDELSLTNCAIVNPREFENVRHVEITGPSQNFIFSLRPDNLMGPGEVGFSAVQVNQMLSTLFYQIFCNTECFI